MKIVTVLGTRPEIIRLSKVIKSLDKLVEHKLYWTGQNRDPSLSDQFFKEFGIRAPDINQRISGSFADQVADMFPIFENFLINERPDKVLILGDTNSSMLAIVAARLGVPVFHVEAGNRTYGPRYAEEINRRVIDHVSDVHMCYNERSRMNLLREGIPIERTFVVGNPVHELIAEHKPRRSSAEPYVLVTIHRQENVDGECRLKELACLLEGIAKDFNIVSCLHPRTIDKVSKFGIEWPGENRGAIGWRDFVNLLYNSTAVITDSGTVQEEASFIGVPCIVARHAQERHTEVEDGGVIIDESPDIDTVTRAISLPLPARPMMITNSPSSSIISILLSSHYPMLKIG